MSKENSTRIGCKDVFRAFLVKNARYEGDLEIPCIEAEDQLPTRLILFSKAIGGKDYAAWVHFYEDDVSFERLWNQPNKYLPILKKYAGVISPDFSVYRDMPLVMLEWNVYRSRNGTLVARKRFAGNNQCALERRSDIRTVLCGCAGQFDHRNQLSRLH